MKDFISIKTNEDPARWSGQLISWEPERIVELNPERNKVAA